VLAVRADSPERTLLTTATAAAPLQTETLLRSIHAGSYVVDKIHGYIYKPDCNAEGVHAHNITAC